MLERDQCAHVGGHLAYLKHFDLVTYRNKHNFS